MIQETISQLVSEMEPVSVLIGLSAVVLLITLWVSRSSQRKIRQLQKELRQARNDLRALTTSSLGVGSRLLDLERRQRKAKTTKPVVERKAQVVDLYDSANQPYDHAIYLAQQGKDIEEIVEMCGISQNEAELIKIMNRLEKAS